MRPFNTEREAHHTSKSKTLKLKVDVSRSTSARLPLKNSTAQGRTKREMLMSPLWEDHYQQGNGGEEACAWRWSLCKSVRQLSRRAEKREFHGLSQLTSKLWDLEVRRCQGYCDWLFYLLLIVLYCDWWALKFLDNFAARGNIYLEKKLPVYFRKT